AGGWRVPEKEKAKGASRLNTTRASKIESESPRRMFHLNSQLNLRDNIECDTTLYYVGSVPYYSIPSYMRLDMGLTWHISRNMDLSVIGQNLLDRAHPEFGDDGVIATEVQRGVLVKLTWRF
ncbi:MAG: TonB-dependent receptor, partial [Planctomycetes bacterium]|nr:TonB-dependent receptor [Planctomycetota bacterium]